MERRLFLTGAGTAGANNLVRSLRAGDGTLVLVGGHHDRFVLRGSAADGNYLMPAPAHPAYAAALRRVLRVEQVDLVIPTSDADVRWFARLGPCAGARLFLPRPRTIALCQDKYRLAVWLRGRGVPAPVTYPVSDPRRIGDLVRRLPGGRAWCRIRTGAGALGAVAIRSPGQARSWIRCWQGMRGVRPTAFTLSEYLPGRDFGCQTLWRDGQLVLAKTCERLSYLGPASRPGEASSVAALARTVVDPRVLEVATAAVRAVDRRATGAFTVDLREDRRGIPRVTEINAGRLSSGTNLFDLTGKHNMALTYVRLGLGEPVDLRDEYDVAEDYYMLRDIDALPAVLHGDDFFEGIDDARARGRGLTRAERSRSHARSLQDLPGQATTVHPHRGDAEDARGAAAHG